MMSLALIDEIMEALRETPWKPWKKQQEFHQEKFKEELIDCWHFLINLTLASGMDAQELYDKFVNKNNENFKRQKNNY
jgi:dimeric dUTPase (all-alpha-NTP-PPase superfamily)